MKESQIQRRLILHYEALGYYVIKLIKTNKNGIPDLICIKERECFFIEVKSEKGKLSELQKYRIKELKEFNIKTIIYDGKRETTLQPNKKQSKATDEATYTQCVLTAS